MTLKYKIADEHYPYSKRYQDAKSIIGLLSRYAAYANIEDIHDALTDVVCYCEDDAFKDALERQRKFLNIIKRK